MKFTNPLSVALVSAFLGLITGLLTARYNYQWEIEALKQEKRILLLEGELGDLRDLHLEFIALMNKRYHCMQNVFWAKEAYDYARFERYFDECQMVKDEWNEKLYSNRDRFIFFGLNNLGLMIVGESMAKDYMMKQDCIQSAFAYAHSNLRAYYRDEDQDSKSRRMLELASSKAMEMLRLKIENFRILSSDLVAERSLEYSKEVGFDD